MQVKEVEINLTAAWRRLGLLLLVGAALVWAVFHASARVRGTQMANMVGEVQSLEAALTYDPSQADVHTRLGVYYLYDPFLFDPSQAVHHFETAVQLQPFDASAWSNLGHAYEQQNDLVRAEHAYRVGIELAPHYFYPRWALANFLLRRGDLPGAFTELRRVADIYPDSIGNICELVKQTTGDDAGVLAEFGTSLRSGRAKWQICQCLIARAESQRAVDLWKTLAENDPVRTETGNSLVAWLSNRGQWLLAHTVWQEVVRHEHSDVSPAGLSFWNGDFEYEATGGLFDWSIISSDAVEARLDTLRWHQGGQSLLLDFKQHQKVSFSGVSHALWVQPSTRYRLRFYYQTEGLSQPNGLAVLLSDTEGPGRFSVQSDPLGNEDHWTSKDIVFETPAEPRILRLQIVRRPVGQIYDYIEGRVWFDSFGLEPTQRVEE